jgi:site-specific DNA-methyltransferase (adenine-specific)
LIDNTHGQLILTADILEQEIEDSANSDIVIKLSDAVEFLRSLSDHSVDCVITDPPYMLSNGGSTCSGGKRVSVNKGDWDRSRGYAKNREFFTSWLVEAQRVLKPTGTIWVTGTYHCIHMIGDIMQELGYHILNDINWTKPNGSPHLAGRMHAAKSETILWASPYKTKKLLHTFNYDLMKSKNIVYKCSFKGCGTISKHSSRFCSRCGNALDLTMIEVRQPTSLWDDINTPSGIEKLRGKHPTQKPVLLMKRIIESSTNENDLIVDMFLGGGTTALVAQILNRRFIGCDNDQNSINLTNDRLAHPEDVSGLMK